MDRRFSNKLACQVGENLIVAELGRRGIVATTLADNVPDIDVLAYRDGNSTAIQVKTSRNGTFQADAAKYLDIEIKDNAQKIRGTKDIDRDLVFAYIVIGKTNADDRFYLCQNGHIQDLIRELHQAYLDKCGGVRPKNPSSTHCSFKEEHLDVHRDNWNIVEDAIG